MPAGVRYRSGMRFLALIVLAACGSSASAPPPAPAPVVAPVAAAPASQNLIGGDAAKRAVIGQELTFSTFAGEKRSQGIVTAADIALVTLDLTKGKAHPVYSVEISRDGAKYRAVVDAFDAHVIGIYPLFST